MTGRKVLGITKLIVLAIMTIPYYLYSQLVDYNKGSNKLKGAALMRRWCRLVVPLMGFSVKREGKLPKGGPYLYVCNHRSSLDPLILLTDVLAYPVSKADVGTYPMVGKGAQTVGVIFVKKTDRSSRQATKETIHASLKEGKSVLIFPEGRTHAKDTTVTFQKGAYEQAADLNVPVVPIAIDYKYTTDYWDHSDTMVDHYFKNLSKWKTPVKIKYGSPIQSDNSFALLRQSQSWINDGITELRAQW
jgi:1-acyl-sn-glycerol-3-phosphate acyltransferase